jgi:hypothetical protein
VKLGRWAACISARANTFHSISSLEDKMRNIGLLELLIIVIPFIAIGIVILIRLSKNHNWRKGATAQNGKSGFAIASMIIGILGLVTWLLPICGFPSSIVGLVLGLMSINSTKRGMAIAGIVMCAISLVASIVNAIIGMYMGVTGQLF